MTHPLGRIFEPRSVAVVGASANPEKRGHQVVAALLASGYQGDVYPVNPRGGSLLGLEVAASVEALPAAPDLAYVATPAEAAPDVVAACGRRGVGAAIVPAVGFRESGPAGADLEARLVEAARRTGIRVIGPNTSGLLNTHVGLHMVGGEPLPRGALGLLAQSGNIALDLMTSASSRPIGVSIYVGPGNEADVGMDECLDFLGAHEPTRAVVLYLEGVRNGRALFETARRVARIKPVIVLKGGRSAAGGRAARSHTGAVAGSYEVFRALARQAGMIEVERADELLPVAETAALQPPFEAVGVAVLSDGGGHATLSADHLTRRGVPLAALSGGTRRALRELLGPAAAVENPVDAAGAVDRAPERFADALAILLDDPACGGVLMTGLFGGYAIRFSSGLLEEESRTADALARAARAAAKPLVVHSLYAPRRPPPLERLLARGVPVYGSLEIAVRSLAALHPGPPTGPARIARRDGSDGGEAPAGAVLEAPGRTPESVGAPPPAGRWLSEREARGIAEAFDVPLVPARFCADSAAARGAATGRGPWVLKLVSSRLPHKTEAGAVRLGLEDPEAVERAFTQAVEAATAYLRARGAAAEIEGALVSPEQPTPLAELLLGARRDEHFGPILTIGAGGIAVELFRDVSIRALPVSSEDIEGMCRELNMAPLLFGHRGRPEAHMASIVAAAAGLARCLEAHEELAELELNPLFVYPDRAVAIDASGYAIEL